MNFLTLIEFVFFFGMMLFVHEMGHYLTAKAFGINVEEFGFGFPPRMVKLFKIKETVFSLNWIPFGAFVRLSGENDPSVRGGFSNARPMVRILVLLGGPMMNLLFGAILFSVMFSQTGVPDYSKVIISSVEPGSPAEQAGLTVGDQIIEVNQVPINSSEELIAIIQTNKGSEVEITVLRGQETVTTRAVPRSDPPAGQGALGIGMTNPLKKVGWLETIPLSIRATYEQCRMILETPGRLIRNEIPSEQARPVGPVGIYSLFSQAREMDEENATSTNPFEKLFTLRLMTIITIALGLTNLLPLPALDGGRILFILPELLFGKRVPAQYENFVHMLGFIALLLLMFYITAQDIINPIQIP